MKQRKKEQRNRDKHMFGPRIQLHVNDRTAGSPDTIGRYSHEHDKTTRTVTDTYGSAIEQRSN